MVLAAAAAAAWAIAAAARAASAVAAQCRIGSSTRSRWWRWFWRRWRRLFVGWHWWIRRRRRWRVEGCPAVGGIGGYGGGSAVRSRRRDGRRRDGRRRRGVCPWWNAHRRQCHADGANSATGGAAGNAVMQPTNRGNGGVGGGGAVFNLNGVVKIYNATLAANTVTGGWPSRRGGKRGAVYNLAVGTGTSATTSVRNSILAGSKGGPDLFPTASWVRRASMPKAATSSPAARRREQGQLRARRSVPIRCWGAGCQHGDRLRRWRCRQTVPQSARAIRRFARRLRFQVSTSGQACTCACDLGHSAVPVPLPCPIPDLSVAATMAESMMPESMMMVSSGQRILADYRWWDWLFRGSQSPSCRCTSDRSFGHRGSLCFAGLSVGGVDRRTECQASDILAIATNLGVFGRDGFCGFCAHWFSLRLHCQRFRPRGRKSSPAAGFQVNRYEPTAAGEWGFGRSPYYSSTRYFAGGIT